MLISPNPSYAQITYRPEIILRVWENDYGVPSVDPECLEIMTLFKIYNVNATIVYGCLPILYDIPSLHYNDNLIPRANLYSYIMTRLCYEHHKLYPRQQEMVKLYKNYFLDNFVQIFLFDCWLDESNYAHAIETWYNNVIPPPFGPKYVETIRKRIRRRFNNVLRRRNPDKFMLECFKTMETCLEDFDGLLKDKRHFLYKNIPTSLDALVYSYLSIALHIPLQKPRVQNIIKRNKRLLQYLKFMTKKYFPCTPGHFKYVDPVLPKYEPADYNSLFLAMLFAGSVMFLYACSIGLIDLQVPQFLLNFNIVEAIVESNFADLTFELLLLPFALLIN